MSKRQQAYPHVLPEIEDWSIYKMHQDRKAFVEEIDEHVFEKLLEKHGNNIDELIAKTLYLERIRMKREPWKVDPADERAFWKQIGKDLIKKSLDREDSVASSTNERLLKSIIHRYSEEIVGTFNKGTFLFARRFLTNFFSRMLNTVQGRFWSMRYRLQDRLQAHGEVEHVRNLMKKGTVVVVPTHFSNLDSILIGYVLDGIAGLPAFTYGAGLNLLNSGIVAYFINRLGAYRVDRRKKNPIYLETLKSMSMLSTKRGVNSIFFPGGTRSRSGALETKLKLGLIGTIIEAQRANLQEGKNEKIFVVPVVLSYHFVLEGKYLIEQHLRQTGKEFYLRAKDKSNSIRRFLFFANRLFSTSNDIIVAFGKPMDVVGNFVDEEGNSIGNNGQKVDIDDYFMPYEGDKINADYQRESVYTRNLGDRILERFFADSVVLSSHLVAFAAFNLLRYENTSTDLYGLLRLPNEDIIFSRQKIENILQQLQSSLFQMRDNDQIKLSEILTKDISSILKDGIRRLGSYHADQPLKINKKGEIISQSFPLLYFYHNRLEHYGLAERIDWKAVFGEHRQAVEL
ncbi:MAG: 1-acyl-sn-glycerol-3-phosphate acyltransferase [Bacteroidota bacterium]